MDGFNDWYRLLKEHKCFGKLCLDKQAVIKLDVYDPDKLRPLLVRLGDLGIKSRGYPKEKLSYCYEEIITTFKLNHSNIINPIYGVRFMIKKHKQCFIIWPQSWLYKEEFDVGKKFIFDNVYIASLKIEQYI